MTIPKGFKLVPVVATMHMKNAGWRECGRQGIEPEDIEMQSIWTAMHLEAQTPPQPIYDEDAERQLFEDTMLIDSEEAGFGEPDLYRDSEGIYRQPYHQAAWGGWIRCAQSRAKSMEVGDE